MSIIIVGGDRLGNINKNLQGMGFKDIEHVTGRKKGDIRRFAEKTDADVILVLTDFINHNLCKMIKSSAKTAGVKTVFARRAWSDIQPSLADSL